MDFVLQGLADIKRGVSALGCRKIDGTSESAAIQVAVSAFIATYELLLEQLNLEETQRIGRIVARPCSICGAPVPLCECGT